MWEDEFKRPEMGKEIFCDATPHVMLNSHGVWEKMGSGSNRLAFWEYPLPKLQIIILSIFLFWRFFDIVFRKLGVPVPQFTSMMLVGAMLSEGLDSIHMSSFHQIFTHDDEKYLPNIAETIGSFAFVLFWFLRGVTTNVGMIKKSGTRCIVIGVVSMIIPWYIGKLVYTSRKESSVVLSMTNQEYRVMIFAMSITPFTCINMLLKELNIVHTEFGQLAQSSAMVTDVLAFTMRVIAYCSHEYSHSLGLGVTFMVFFVFLFLVRQAMFWVIRHTPEGASVRNIYVYSVLLLAYLSYLYWTHFLFFGMLGAFILGLAIPEGPPIGSAFIQRFDSFNTAIFLPLFGSFAMIKLDWPFLRREFGHGKHFQGFSYECFSFISVLYLVKFLSSFLPAIAAKMPLRDSFILGLILGTKSSFELAYLLFAFEKKAITLEVYTLVGVYILVNSLLTPMAIHILYDRSKRFICYGKRNLKHRSELQTLVCINKPNNIASMISLLKTTSHSKDSPMTCFVLHLVELMGQATPTFISHQLQKPKPGSQSYSENVISSFQEIQGESSSIHIFTSLTFAKEMHEHICWFALDKSSNLILLSFHRTWGVDGNVVVCDDQVLRNLNRNVLKRAPCSVGIFVYRKSLWRIKPVEQCQVCVIYVGGNDDEEALALAEHMRGNQQVSLTVLRLIPDESNKSSQTVDTKEDDEEEETPQEEQDNNNNSVVKYIDRFVVNGIETSKILHSIAYDYDLFLVGRTTGISTVVTKGLRDWMDFDELGVIGDLLASQDFPSRASVLVVQQQE